MLRDYTNLIAGTVRLAARPTKMHSGRFAILFCLLCVPGLIVAQTSPSSRQASDQPLKPSLKFSDLASYEKEIAEPGVLLQSEHLWLFAPKSRSREANAIFKILVKAYDELYRIVGVHTKYKLIV